ncbi:PocR ligand-binding domain-containing protein [Candidatus Dependentiae bacterium]|nr:PocR ligand-binding domain-containing protein [Candidatus Dependentiae bacterium]
METKKSDDMNITEFLNIAEIQLMMDDFYKLTNIGIGIIDLQGNILVSTGWQDICTKFHRVHPETRKNCIESDVYLSKNVEKGVYLQYKCKNNMWDIVTPIIINGKHFCNLFLGQFFFDDETPDVEAFAAQADKYGFDKTKYIEALNKVPRWSRDTVKNVMNFYSKFAVFIADLSYNNLMIKESESKYRTLLENLPQKIFLKDVNSVYISCNKNYANDLNIKPEEIVGKTDYDFYPKEFAEKYRKDDKRLIETDTAEVFEEEYIQNDKKFWINTFKIPVKNIHNEITGILGIFHDITEKKELEKQLLQSEKLSAVGKLTAGVAHEFNNLMAIIQVNNEIINYISKEKNDEELKNCAKVISETIHRGKSIVLNMMTFAKPKEPEKNFYYIRDIFNETIKLQEKELALENITINMKFSGLRTKIFVDKSQIEQVFLNMIINARHAIIPKGKGTIEIESDIENKFIVFYIKDNGIGIPNDKIKNIFEPFFTTKGAMAKDSLGIKGTGLGLSVSYTIIKNHGGNIEVESEEGKGTVFKIILPIKDTKIKDDDYIETMEEPLKNSLR